ncbi:MAG: hypothetical protein KBD01_02830 [Acidobacteria bacterium]|nr:hypothetical protein [Acidobacteriota bacterium]
MRLAQFQILDQWHLLVRAAGHKGARFVIALERALAAAALPGIEWHEASIAAGFLKSLRGKRRDVLVITTRAFPEHRVLVSHYPYGTALGVGRFVVVRPRIGRDARRLLSIPRHGTSWHEVGSEHDVFECMDLAAAIAVVDNAVNVAVGVLKQPESEGTGESGTSSADVL